MSLKSLLLILSLPYGAVYGQKAKDLKFDYSFSYELNSSVDVNLYFSKRYNEKWEHAFTYDCIGDYKNNTQPLFKDGFPIFNAKFTKLHDSLNISLTELGCPNPFDYKDIYKQYFDAFSKSEKWKEYYERFKQFPNNNKYFSAEYHKFIESIILETDLYKDYLDIVRKKGYKIKSVSVEQIRLIPVDQVEYRLNNWNGGTNKKTTSDEAILRIPLPMSITCSLEK